MVPKKILYTIVTTTRVILTRPITLITFDADLDLPKVWPAFEHH